MHEFYTYTSQRLLLTISNTHDNRHHQRKSDRDYYRVEQRELAFPQRKNAAF